MRTGWLLALFAVCAPAGASAQETGGAPPDTLTLRAAMDAALAKDPRLAAARAGVDAAGAGRAEARAAWLPALGTSASVTRFQEPMVVAPLHGFDPRTPPEFDRTLAQGRISVGWTVFDGGARGSRVAAAGALADAARAGATQARMDAVLAVLEAYLRVAGARETVAARDTRERDLEAEVERAGRFVAEGAAPRLELLRAQAELEEARAQGVGADAALAAAEDELARVIGEPVERVARAALSQVRPSATVAAAAERADPHPALSAARARTAAAAAVAREARSAWLPRVQGNGAVVEYGRGDGDFTAEWQAGVQAEYTLFSGGARRARIDRARAEARRAEAEAQEIEEGLARARAWAIAALSDAEARTAALASAVERFDELVRVQELALDEGAGVQADYLRALSGLHGARLGLAEARRSVVLARARLARAEGTLDPEWVATHLEETR